MLAPICAVGRWLKELDHEIHLELGFPTFMENCLSLVTLVFALWTKIKLKLNIFQHPSLVRHNYRDPQAGLLPSHWWRALRKDGSLAELTVRVRWDQGKDLIRIHLEGVLDSFNTEEPCITI